MSSPYDVIGSPGQAARVKTYVIFQIIWTNIIEVMDKIGYVGI